MHRIIIHTLKYLDVVNIAISGDVILTALLIVSIAVIKTAWDIVIKQEHKLTHGYFLRTHIGDYSDWISILTRTRFSNSQWGRFCRIIVENALFRSGKK